MSLIFFYYVYCLYIRKLLMCVCVCLCVYINSVSCLVRREIAGDLGGVGRKTEHKYYLNSLYEI